MITYVKKLIKKLVFKKNKNQDSQAYSDLNMVPLFYSHAAAQININTMLNNLKWMNIAQRLQFNTLKFIRKLKQIEAPKYLCDQIHYVGDSQPY